MDEKLQVVLASYLAHEVNRAYCEAIEDAPIPPWHEASEEMKRSCALGVISTMKSLEMTPEEIHNLWMDHKTKQGWVLGPVKDEQKKVHPCLVPYRDLNKDQKTKDYLFRSVVRAVALASDALGLQIAQQEFLPNRFGESGMKAEGEPSCRHGVKLVESCDRCNELVENLDEVPQLVGTGLKVESLEAFHEFHKDDPGWKPRTYTAPTTPIF